MSGPNETRVRHRLRRSVSALVLLAFGTSACQEILDRRRSDPPDDDPRSAPSPRTDAKVREPSNGPLEPGLPSSSGMGRIAGVPEPLPPPGVSSSPQPSTANGLKPFSFAPLAAQADPSVATVKAFVRGNVGGRERTLGEGLGTAFVYDSAGFLLTNNHVIEQASEILVGFPDGREFPARVVGADARTDVAVLKIDATGLPALPLGDSDRTQVGEWVVAIGNPFGLAHTVSVGILSAKGRTRDDVNGLDPSGYFNFLQTDASINPGNSGGPLIDLDGRVVGINAAVRQNANSIGFAIPINMVRQLLPMLLRDGRIRRSALGVLVADVDRSQASKLGIPPTGGAWVKGLQRNGPAEQGGILVDDVIVAFDGKPVDGSNMLRWYASIFGVGQSATVRVLRGGKPVDLRVQLSELPE